MELLDFANLPLIPKKFWKPFWSLRDCIQENADAEVNISPYAGTPVPALFFFLVQLYSNQGVSCRNIGQEQLRVI